jgi:hypothetical protein
MKKILILLLITSYILTKDTDAIGMFQVGMGYVGSAVSGITSIKLLLSTVYLYKRTANKPRLALRIGFTPRFNIASSSIWGLLAVAWYRVAKKIKEDISGYY